MRSKFDFWSEFDRGMEVWLWNWHLLGCRSFHFRFPARDRHWHWEWQHSICIQQQQRCPGTQHRCPGTLLVHSGTLVHCWYSPGALLSNNNTGQWGDKKELSLAIIWQSYMSCIHWYVYNIHVYVLTIYIELTIKFQLSERCFECMLCKRFGFPCQLARILIMYCYFQNMIQWTERVIDHQNNSYFNSCFFDTKLKRQNHM